MEKFEYTQLYASFMPDADGMNHTGKLNEFGQLGWELITALKVDNHNVCYILKRPLEQRFNQSAKDLLIENN